MATFISLKLTNAKLNENSDQCRTDRLATATVNDPRSLICSKQSFVRL